MFMKLGSNENLKYFLIPLIGLHITYISIIGYVCYIFSFLLYTIIISKFELGVIVPILSGLVNIGVLIIAFFVFNESFNNTKLVGVILVCLGIILINLKR